MCVQTGKWLQRFNSTPRVHNPQSDKVHEDFILHDAGDLGHPGLWHGSSLTSGHQDLTCTQVWEAGGERGRDIEERDSLYCLIL